MAIAKDGPGLLPSERRQNKTADRILMAAIDAFGTRGYGATSLDDLARELGIRKQTILYWYPAKEALLDAAVDRTAAEVSVRLERPVSPAGEGFARVDAPVRAVVSPLVRRKMAQRLVERDFLRGGLDTLYERMDCVLDELELRAPADGFWIGPRASVADLGLFAQLHSLRLPGLWLAEVLQKRERLTRYLDRVDAVTR